MKSTETFNQAADYYLSINSWLAKRYQQRDKNGRTWLAHYTNGQQPTRYKRLERAFFYRYVMPWKGRK